MKIRPVGAELFHTQRQTDTTELIVTFRNFWNGPKYIFVFITLLRISLLILITGRIV